MARSRLGSLLRALVALGLLGLAAVVALPGGPLTTGGGGDQPATGPAPTAASPTGAPTTTTAGPWDHRVLTVAVRNRAAPTRNVTGAVGDAITYWNAHAGYAAYPVGLRLVPNASRPDVVVRYERSITCPNHDDAIGCAPLLAADARVDPPATVQLRYDPADDRRQVRNTAIHELGHVLGVGHCDPPHWVMGASCPAPLPDATDATERPLAWRDHTIRVYVDAGNVSAGERARTADQVSHALAYLDGGANGSLPSDLSLVRVDDRFAADVVVTFAADPSCRDGVVCTRNRGRDSDGDGRIEYYTGGIVVVDPGSDVAARGWYVGWGLASELAPGHLPPTFVDAGYEERRSRWWA